MSFFQALILIGSGVVVGFINTLAGGGTIISISIFMLMGLPASVANGTNRIAVILQNITSASSFHSKGLLDIKKGLKIAIPTVIGSVIGALLAVEINEAIFKIAFGIIMIFMIIMMIVKPDKWINERVELQNKKFGLKQWLIFFIIGIYGGFIQIGVGYFLLASFVLSMGYNLLKANGLKLFVVLIYTLFAIIVFIVNKQINWQFGLIHAVGNIIGAFIASHWAIKWGSNFIRWAVIIFTLVFIIDLFGFINIKALIVP